MILTGSPVGKVGYADIKVPYVIMFKAHLRENPKPQGRPARFFCFYLASNPTQE